MGRFVGIVWSVVRFVGFVVRPVGFILLLLIKSALRVFFLAGAITNGRHWQRIRSIYQRKHLPRIKVIQLADRQRMNQNRRCNHRQKLRIGCCQGRQQPDQTTQLL